MPRSGRLPMCQSCSQRRPQEQLKGFPTRTLRWGREEDKDSPRERISSPTDPAPSRMPQVPPLSPSPHRGCQSLPLPASPALSLPPRHRRVHPRAGMLRTYLPLPHHSQLLQGQMLEALPGEALQRVEGEIPAGMEPISRPFAPQTPSSITPSWTGSHRDQAKPPLPRCHRRPGEKGAPRTPGQSPSPPHQDSTELPEGGRSSPGRWFPIQ